MPSNKYTRDLAIQCLVESAYNSNDFRLWEDVGIGVGTLMTAIRARGLTMPDPDSLILTLGAVRDEIEMLKGE